MRSISLIAALDESRLIGAGNGLPWRLPNDLKYFKAHTLGKTVLMGRKTWDTLPHALPGRDNWVLTREPDFSAVGARVFHALKDALAAHTQGELMVVGGAQLYAMTLPLADRLYLTQIHERFTGDTWFPPLKLDDWREVERDDRAADARHAHAYSFVTYARA